MLIMLPGKMYLTKENIMVGDDIELMFEHGVGHVQKLLLEMHGSNTIQISAETGKQLTAILALKRSTQLARKLIELGVKKGDVVTINSRNCTEYIIVPLSCFYIGAIFSPLNPDYTKHELDHVVKLTKPKLAFCSLETVKLMRQLKQEHSFMKELIVFGVQRLDNVIMYEDIIRGVTAESNFEDFPPVHVNPVEDVAAIMCSSGTTGLPKGVMITHRNITAMLEITRALFSDMDPNEAKSLVALALSPMFHSMGLMSTFLNTMGGKLMVVMEKFQPKLFFECIEKYRINAISIAPPVVLVLLKHPLAKKYDLSSLKYVRSGAAPLSKEMEQELLQRFNLKHVSQSYGLTEATLGVLMSKNTITKSGSVGYVVPGMMCKIVNEQGQALGPNQEGELCCKGHLVMKGYLNDPVATANSIDLDGWLHTGDIGYFDNNNYYYIVSRLKELIKYNGFQVAPAELEHLLLEHPDVIDVGVIGLPDPAAGELPLAFVVRKPGAKVTEKQLQDYVAERISRQKSLRGGVHFIEEIPKNASGKTLRRTLKQRAIASITNSKI